LAFKKIKTNYRYLGYKNTYQKRYHIKSYMLI
jgi:hypothetical protein